MDSGKFPYNGSLNSFNPFNYNEVPKPDSVEQDEGEGLLEEYGRNLTDVAKAGLIDPVIGRDEEIKRVIEVLNRRNKNNPVLIGEPGVGKTAIAEGLALAIAEVQCLVNYVISWYICLMSRPLFRILELEVNSKNE